MGLLLEYSDVPSINIYAYIFTSGNLAYKPAINDLALFTDATATGFANILSEDVNRAGYYRINQTGTYFTNANSLNIEIWERIGSVISKADDVLKATVHTNWNGLDFLDDAKIPEIDGPSYLGNFNWGDNVNLNIIGKSIYGLPSTLDTVPYYYLYTPAGSLLSSGAYSNVGPNNLYTASITLVSGTHPYGNYNIISQGNLNSYVVRSISHFTLSNPTNLNNIVSMLGYASGTINDGSPTASSWICTINSVDDDQFTGQVIRFRDNNLVGEARIISDFVQSTKRLTTHIPFSRTPSNGASFLIFPLGGEYGL